MVSKGRDTLITGYHEFRNKGIDDLNRTKIDLIHDILVITITT